MLRWLGARGSWIKCIAQGLDPLYVARLHGGGAFGNGPRIKSGVTMRCIGFDLFCCVRNGFGEAPGLARGVGKVRWNRTLRVYSQ